MCVMYMWVTEGLEDQAVQDREPLLWPQALPSQAEFWHRDHTILKQGTVKFRSPATPTPRLASDTNTNLCSEPLPSHNLQALTMSGMLPCCGLQDASMSAHQRDYPSLPKPLHLGSRTLNSRALHYECMPEGPCMITSHSLKTAQCECMPEIPCVPLSQDPGTLC